MQQNHKECMTGIHNSIMKFVFLSKLMLWKQNCPMAQMPTYVTFQILPFYHYFYWIVRPASYSKTTYHTVVVSELLNVLGKSNITIKQGIAQKTKMKTF